MDNQVAQDASAPFLTCKDSVYIKIKSITVKTASGFGTDIRTHEF